MDMWLVPHAPAGVGQCWVHRWRYIGVVILGPLTVFRVPLIDLSPLSEVTWPGRTQHCTREASSAEWGRRAVHAAAVGAKANAAKHPIGDSKQHDEMSCDNRMVRIDGRDEERKECLGEVLATIQELTAERLFQT